MPISDDFSPPDSTRRIWSNRTLNLRSIGAIGYDMDYTLVHYHVATWEGRAYARLHDQLTADGWPLQGLEFDPDLVIRGLVIDAELGNVLKANRFGYVIRATHGTRPMEYEEQRATYRQTQVDLSEPRFYFLNTLFSLSETCLYAQLVDLYDAGRLPETHGYADILRRVRRAQDLAHIEGTLKSEIIARPETFVELDPQAALALLDQREAGMRLMLITNSEWSYARAMMAWAFDRFLPQGVTWTNLFELVVVGARKPGFFTYQLPLFRVVDAERGLLEPVPGDIPGPGPYLGGDAARVERYLGMSGSEILYVGDHVFADVRVSKSYLRWRTALILRELEDEVAAVEDFRIRERKLVRLMAEKTRLEEEACRLRLGLQRLRTGIGPPPVEAQDVLFERQTALRDQLDDLDSRIAPMARAAGTVGHSWWGPVLRAGNDSSHLARQLERSADVYTSRVSNFLWATPFAYLRANRTGMPHDPACPPDPPEPN
jgi:HAD superfamily 5'-nucleotidase-like hydrolase